MRTLFKKDGQSNEREAGVAMERVLAVVAHELRTPLAGLRAMTEYLIAAQSAGSPDVHRFLHSVHQEVIHMSDIVDNLLEAARLNSGKAKWNWGSFDLAPICQEVIDLMRPLIDETSIRLQLTIKPPDMTLKCDGAAIRRLLLNLLSNARKHTTHGKIELAARSYVEWDYYWVEMSVSDTGQGISSEVAAHLGEAFALNSGCVSHKRVSGTGVGLAICSAIAAAHGGRLTIQSQVGQGTTVRAVLRADLGQPACATQDVWNLLGSPEVQKKEG